MFLFACLIVYCLGWLYNFPFLAKNVKDISTVSALPSFGYKIAQAMIIHPFAVYNPNIINKHLKHKI